MGTATSERTRVKVIKHLPLGLLVQLENGEQGFVRVREISWDQDKRLNWKQLYPVDLVAWAVSLRVEGRASP